MGILEDILATLQSIDRHIQEQTVAITTQVINVTVVAKNAPPQYTGQTTINDLVVGVTRQLQGFDPDGDQIIWTMDENSLATVSPSGVLTPIASGTGAITVHLDDGKP